jgi:hypothetical protein
MHDANPPKVGLDTKNLRKINMRQKGVAVGRKMVHSILKNAGRPGSGLRNVWFTKQLREILSFPAVRPVDPTSHSLRSIAGLVRE